jgi:hypothetical protein
MEEQKQTETSATAEVNTSSDGMWTDISQIMRIGIMLAVIYFLPSCYPVRDFIRQFTTVEEAKVQSLQGMMSTDIRVKIGKPDRVEFNSKSSAASNRNDARNDSSSSNELIEIWRYYRKVPHTASGVKRDLELEIQNGICKKVSLR